MMTGMGVSVVSVFVFLPTPIVQGDLIHLPELADFSAF